jgi:signal transduction histidine kinase
MGLRHRSIRLSVGILIAVPLLCVICLYAFAASITLGRAITQAHAKALRAQLLNPVTQFQKQLDAEEGATLLWLANPTSTPLQYDLSTEQTATMQDFATLKQVLGSGQVRADASAQETSAIKAFLGAANTLPYLRAIVADRTITLSAALDDYDAIVAAGYVVLDEALDQQADVPLVAQALDVVNLDKAAQVTLTESELLRADIEQRSFPQQDRLTFSGLVSQRRALMAQTLPELDPGYQSLIGASVNPAINTALFAEENLALSSPWPHGQPPALLVANDGAFRTYTLALGTALRRVGNDLQAQAQHDANQVFLQLVLAAGLGLVGTIASVALSLVIGRNLVRQLGELRQSALTLAHDQLPDVMHQLRAGQPVEVLPAQQESGEPTQNEIEQVQQAFSVVRTTAIQAAVDEARLRRGISDVFRNLAGRSQSLLHRQLTLLDGMERRASEPEELENLFRLDHLTTRMRRHAEGLIILSGESPARGWRQPVPLVDVLRAAVAEVEDYTRIRVLSRTRAAVAGPAVADVIHLIAELAENATVFSPPNTPVRIEGDIVGRGFAIEIEDRGLGISAERLAEINANLADPPQFDLSGSDRLGLFITAQLARRHGISVTLRPSVYGGTTAIVLIPTALVVEEDSYQPDPALEQGQASGRHAALTSASLDRPRLAGVNGHQPGGFDADLSPAGLPAGSQAAASTDQWRIAIHTEPASGGIRGVAPPSQHSLPAPVAEESFSGVPQGESDGTIRGVVPQGEYNLPERLGDDLDERVTTAELEELGLPVRVRQANLAPQLRTTSPTGQPPAAVPADAAEAESTTSPEAARDTMSALQRGWQLGRAEASADVYPRPAEGGASPADRESPRDQADADAAESPAQDAADQDIID